MPAYAYVLRLLKELSDEVLRHPCVTGVISPPSLLDAGGVEMHNWYRFEVNSTKGPIGWRVLLHMLASFTLYLIVTGTRRVIT